MVVTTGQSTRHVASIAEHLIEKLKAQGVQDITSEGFENCNWVVVDAYDVIIHVFLPQVREFYNLEKMWKVALPELNAEGELVAG